MSNTLKFVLVLIAIMAVGGLYVLKQNEAKFSASLSPHQGIDTMMTTGQIEVKSFHDWCSSQGHQGEALTACVTKREAKAKLLLQLERDAKNAVNNSPAIQGESETQEPPKTNGEDSKAIE